MKTESNFSNAEKNDFRIKIKNTYSINSKKLAANSNKKVKENSFFITNQKPVSVKNRDIILNKFKKIPRKKALNENNTKFLNQVIFDTKLSNLFDDENINSKLNLKLKRLFSSKKIKNYFEISFIFQSTKIFIGSTKSIQINILKQQFEFIDDNLKTSARLLLDSRIHLKRFVERAIKISQQKKILNNIINYRNLLKNNSNNRFLKKIYSSFQLICYNDKDENKIKNLIVVKEFVSIICSLYKILELMKELIVFLIYYFKNDNVLNIEELELQKNSINLNLKSYKTYFDVFNAIAENHLYCWMALENFFELFNLNFFFVEQKYKKIKVFLNAKYFFMVCQNLRFFSTNINKGLKNLEKILYFN
jgi:hypothetical protein